MTIEEKADAFDRMAAIINEDHPNNSGAEPYIKVYLLGYQAVNNTLKPWLTGPNFNGDIIRIAKNLPEPKTMLPESPWPECIAGAWDKFKSRVRGAVNHDQHLRDEGFITGKASCLSCSHEWRCAIEPETIAHALECPECHTQNSVFTQT